MPQGIKPASSLFQRTMEQMFSDLCDYILPPFYDDVVIKGSDFQKIFQMYEEFEIEFDNPV